MRSSLSACRLCASIFSLSSVTIIPNFVIAPATVLAGMLESWRFQLLLTTWLLIPGGFSVSISSCIAIEGLTERGGVLGSPSPSVGYPTSLFKVEEITSLCSCIPFVEKSGMSSPTRGLSSSVLIPASQAPGIPLVSRVEPKI